LQQLATLDHSTLDPRLNSLAVEAAVDVDNPLLGSRGASAVFGPQKGASPDDVATLDRAIGHFAELSAQVLGRDEKELAGAGAAGGMGFAARSFLNATLTPGIEIMMQQAKLPSLLPDIDVVITGEGRLDGQSLSGKTPIGVARTAKHHGKPVIVLAGSLGEGWQACLEEGVTAAFALADGPMTLEDALPRTAELLADRCESIARLWLAR
ncbi:MAG: glycerate kinase, partial [Halomonas venusta]|nr:glycerate kinase [Halomonas venusta]